MKKSFAAFAVLGACAQAACAQSSLTLYGLFDIGISRENNGAAAGSMTRIDSGIQCGSRLGFKGSEDLGGGLGASFMLENGFNGDTGTMAQGGRLFGRLAWLGLNGGLGSVKVGRQNTPLFATLVNIDPFATGLAGDISRLFSNGGQQMSNTVNYSTPALGGLSAQFAYGFGEVAGDTAALRQMGFASQYAAGALSASIAYHNASNATGIGGSTRTTLLASTYNFGPVTAHLGYAINKGDTTAGGTVLDTRDMMIGVSVPAGAGTLMASYIRKSDKMLANADASQAGLGYSYALSKRTNLYTSYSRTTNDSGARYNIDPTAVAGARGTWINAGVQHNF